MVGRSGPRSGRVVGPGKSICDQASITLAQLAPRWFSITSVIMSLCLAPYPSGKGEVCKTFMHRFESDRRLLVDTARLTFGFTIFSFQCPSIAASEACPLLYCHTTFPRRRHHGSQADASGPSSRTAMASTSVSIVAMRTPRGRHLVTTKLTNTPLWSYLRSVRSSEKSVKL